MVREREAFIGRTNEKARDVTDKAQARATELVSQSRIMAEAVEEATALIRQAEAEGSRIRLEAEDEIDRWFVRLDTVFTGVVNQLQAMPEPSCTRRATLTRCPSESGDLLPAPLPGR